MSWKITLKNGEVITNPDFYQVRHEYNYWSFNKRIILKRKIVKGHFWWKKEIEETETEITPLLIIPTENILKVERIGDMEGEDK